MLDEGAGSRDALADRRRRRIPRRATSTTASSFDASAVRLNVPVARLARSAADHGRRRAAADVPAEGARSPPPGAAHRPAPGPRRSGIGRADGVRARGLRRHAPVRHRRHRHRVHAEGVDRDGPAQRSTRRCTSRRTPRWSSSATCSADAVLPLLEKQFGGWKGGGGCRTHTGAGRAASSRERQVTIVDMPKAEQSQIRIGWVGVPRSTPDYFTLQVLNTILGGSFTSRLNQNLREEHGYTYGASSRFDMRLCRRTVLRRRRRADRQDVRGAARVLQRAERDRQAGRRRGADEGQELHRARISERVRNDRATSPRTSRR